MTLRDFTDVDWIVFLNLTESNERFTRLVCNKIQRRSIMNLARKGKVLGFAAIAGFLVAISGTPPAKGEPTVGGSELVGS
jgi:hypothetical protein